MMEIAGRDAPAPQRAAERNLQRCLKQAGPQEAGLLSRENAAFCRNGPVAFRSNIGRDISLDILLINKMTYHHIL
ncbi:hypothetical protein AW736_20655 [Termitidicoccus mucosus]|uniref:Uncharacterized protein n=1 Tax=Termitidicoccus mucosus TaxID=1184151 RepID=A0A178IDH7_9BACT|nr:hypothetical protein AW736_20655 [Opitutaceae bacterium TSB47]